MHSNFARNKKQSKQCRITPYTTKGLGKIQVLIFYANITEAAIRY